MLDSTLGNTRRKSTATKNTKTNYLTAVASRQIQPTITMPKLKRTSENQITKDNYDRDEEDSRFSEEPDPGIGMKRASASVMQGRKIIKASR